MSGQPSSKSSETATCLAAIITDTRLCVEGPLGADIGEQEEACAKGRSARHKLSRQTAIVAPLCESHSYVLVAASSVDTNMVGITRQKPGKG